MSSLSFFMVGSGHNRSESENLLVKLHRNCNALNPDYERVKSGFRHRMQIRFRSPGHFKLLFNGPGGTGGIGAFTDGVMGCCIKQDSQNIFDNVLAYIRATGDRSPKVYLVGHSRGAVSCIRAGSLLAAHPRTRGLPVHMVLLDPVKFSVRSSIEEYQTVHTNVKKLKAIVMEDVVDSVILSTGRGGGFNLLDFEREDGEFTKKEIIRMPGKHGTASQVTKRDDGEKWPIGQVTYQLARRWLRKWGVPMGGTTWTDEKICNEYFKIHILNPHRSRDRTRLINDSGVAAGQSAVDLTKGPTRVSTLAVRGGAFLNKFCRTSFFINEHHFRLMVKNFPALAQVLKDSLLGSVALAALTTELKRLESQCPAGFRHVMCELPFFEGLVSPHRVPPILDTGTVHPPEMPEMERVDVE